MCHIESGCGSPQAIHTAEHVGTCQKARHACTKLRVEKANSCEATPSDTLGRKGDVEFVQHSGRDWARNQRAKMRCANLLKHMLELAERDVEKALDSTCRVCAVALVEKCAGVYWLMAGG